MLDDQGNTISNDSTETIITPLIRVKKHGEEIITVDVELEGEVTENGKYLRTQKLGRALLQIVNRKWISGSFVDYINGLMEKNPEDKHILLKKLQYSLQMIESGKKKLTGTLCVFHIFEIYNMFRGNGFAKPFIWLILKALKEELDVEYVFLHAYPLEVTSYNEEGIINEQQRIEKMYFDSGFQYFGVKKLISKSYDGLPIKHMYCNLLNKSYATYNF